MSTVSVRKYLFTDVGDHPYVTMAALMFVKTLSGDEKVSVIVHITNHAGISVEEMLLFNKVQVRFGALDNLMQMRDVIFNKENIHNHVSIT